jgi:carbonic anhydrase
MLMQRGQNPAPKQLFRLNALHGYNHPRMKKLNDILRFNKSFVKKKGYKSFVTDRFPDKRMVILTCMDTRLTELLPKALNLRNGDAKIIKNAGAIVSHPFGSVMRSILVAVYNLKADTILVIGHHNCGMTGLKAGTILKQAPKRGIRKKDIQAISRLGVNLEEWLTGFRNVRTGVKQSIEIIKAHPLLPPKVKVYGFIIHPKTGKLEKV